MNIQKKLNILIEQSSLDEVNRLLEQTTGTITLWCARAVEHKEYSGEIPLYWLVDTLAQVKDKSLSQIEAWERLKENLMTCYSSTEDYLSGPADVLARLLVYLREFMFDEWRPMKKRDFKHYVSQSLDSDKYRKKRDAHMMIPDFWKDYRSREKARFSRRSYSSPQVRRQAFLASEKSRASSANNAS